MSAAPYKMTLHAKLEDGNGVLMCENTTVYSNLDYENVVELEAAILDGARALGQKAAERKRGSGKK